MGVKKWQNKMNFIKKRSYWNEIVISCFFYLCYITKYDITLSTVVSGCLYENWYLFGGWFYYLPIHSVPNNTTDTIWVINNFPYVLCNIWINTHGRTQVNTPSLIIQLSL